MTLRSGYTSIHKTLQLLYGINNFFRGEKFLRLETIMKTIKLRGKGGPLLQVGPNQFAIMREKDIPLSPKERFKKLSESRDIKSRIIGMPKIKPIEINLSNLGKVVSFVLKKKNYEAVLLKISPMVLETLNKTIGPENYKITEKGNIIVQEENNLPKIIPAINKETGLKLALFRNTLAETAAEECGKRLLAKGIHWFWAIKRDGSIGRCNTSEDPRGGWWDNPVSSEDANYGGILLRMLKK